MRYSHITTIKPKKILGTFNKKPAPDKNIPHNRYAELFELFLTASTHEIGNYFHILNMTAHSQKDNKTKEKLDKIFWNFQKLQTCGELLNGINSDMNQKIERLFEKREQKRLGICEKDGKLFADEGKIKRNAVTISQELISALKMFEDSSPFEKDAELELDKKKLLGYGKTLAKCIMELSLGTFDFKTELNSGKAYSVLRGIPRNKLECEYISKENEEFRILHIPPLTALIVKNIYSNAMRAMENKGVEDAKIHATIRSKGNMVLIEFRDSGGGMDIETLNKLNRGIRVTTKENPEKYNGSGFCYCRALAHNMQGKLYIKETSPQGTTVVLELQKE